MLFAMLTRAPKKPVRFKDMDSGFCDKNVDNIELDSLEDFDVAKEDFVKVSRWRSIISWAIYIIIEELTLTAINILYFHIIFKVEHKHLFLM